MDIQRFASFTYEGGGGNPAGVAICAALPDADSMQKIAADIGFSETVFAAPSETGYRVRYFAPAKEIPFCGHATIALGAALADRGEVGPIVLKLNEGEARVEGFLRDGVLSAVLTSAPTRHQSAPRVLLQQSLDLFALSKSDLDERFPSAIIEAGARHLLLAVQRRERLSSMRYDMQGGAEVMNKWQLATINLIYAESFSRYHSRNPFASGGVYEDPATGAAAAALVAYLSEIGISGAECIEVIQGQDMGTPCLITVYAPTGAGGGARVQGDVRRMPQAI